ncbi:hypothetical protein BH10ACT7_BH10ACT7_05580 [soil metagenome]
MVDKYATVAEFLAAQPADRRAEVETLRSLVRDAAPDITEIIKWNSPSYVHNGEDRLTINAAGRGPVLLILHRGTSQAEDKSAATSFTGDPEGLLTWHSDIRASMPVPTDTSRGAAVALLRHWLG